MPYQVMFNQEFQVIESEKWGMTHFGDLRAAGREAQRLSNEHKVKRFLCCASGVELNSPISILDFAKAYAEAGMGKGNQMAVVLPLDFKHDRDATEVDAIAAKWGFRVSRFETRQAAIEWLQESLISNMPDAGDAK